MIRKIFKVIKNIAFTLLTTVLIVLIIGIVTKSQLVRIKGTSMEPTLKENQQIFIEGLSMDFREPNRLDIVVFKDKRIKDKLIIKRVIGLPGETFKFQSGQVYINDKPLDESSYIKPAITTTEESYMHENVNYIIDDGSYVVLGDNRADSTDSREWGFLKKEEIIGKALFIYYPRKDIRSLTGF